MRNLFQILVELVISSYNIYIIDMFVVSYTIYLYLYLYLYIYIHTENSTSNLNSKTLFYKDCSLGSLGYKDCSLGSFKNLATSPC